MNDISLRIKIANREYPMRVKADEEENVRLVSKIINDKVKKYRNQFSIEDKQDLLAMVAFESTMNEVRESQGRKTSEEEATDMIQRMNDSISNALNK